MTLPGGDSGDKSSENTGVDQSFAQQTPPVEQEPPAYQQPQAPPPGYPGFAGPPPQYGPQPGPEYHQSYSPGSYPGPGPDQYGYGYASASHTTTNTMAIASLVLSALGIVPFCGNILSIVGIVLGAVALSQIKETRQEGYGIAVAGIVVGVAMLIVGLIWTIFALR